VRPEHVVVKVGDQAAFSCTAIDQYGQPIGISQVQWSAIGGSIDSSGLFTAGDRGGAFTVKATVDGNEAHAEVRISTKDEVPPPPPPPGERYVRWRGAVPPQKWMNFYTKVLSRFASTPGLRLTVRFVVPPESKVTRAQIEETRTALRELGLEESLEL
jgi:hypothetical protein